MSETSSYLSASQSEVPCRTVRDLPTQLADAIEYMSENTLNCSSLTCQKRRGETFRDLLNRCVDCSLQNFYTVDEETKDKISKTLEQAICTGTLRDLPHFIRHLRVNIRKLDENGASLLHLTAAVGNWRLVEILLKMGADPTVEFGPAHDRLTVLDCMNPAGPWPQLTARTLLQAGARFCTDRIFVAMLGSSRWRENFGRAMRNGTDLLRSPCDTATRLERYHLLVRHAPSPEAFSFFHRHVAKLDWNHNQAALMVLDALLCRKPDLASYMIRHGFPLVVRCTSDLPEVDEALDMGYVGVLQDLFARDELRGYRDKELLLQRCEARRQMREAEAEADPIDF
ncbi:uncharacterized protein BO97DRAFT_421954 [Aspergillus homomorphus CBS 101889]|uniref:Uncharacterized protein n=1 Tax=Aspergillus homomorphus (strain CBS 101889) TaxID=1450537 RepID=A0A395I4Z8_ASPHC|nr:hypothetical protein BO97DRAFT_421954 [Aspergillus homomorphus CBS 101889]RAL15160.1 hypothetical protein BO97DRAFT_421954 [Aspergillus homomorphus CBS 101889]